MRLRCDHLLRLQISLSLSLSSLGPHREEEEARRRKQDRRIKSSSWPKTVVRKWLNLKNPDFQSDCNSKFGEIQRRKSCSDKDSSVLMRRDLSGGWLVESSDNLEPLRPSCSQSKSPAGTSLAIENLRRVFVGTWNVGGRPPHGGFNLRDWLMSSPSSSAADIYVLGFQEIVPLNAGNVLGPEDKGPAYRWLSLIRQALNPQKAAVFPCGANGTAEKPRFSFSDLLSMEPDREERDGHEPPSSSCSDEPSPDRLPAAASSTAPRHRGEDYCLVASKQMVGIFLCVWVRAGLVQGISSLKVSCVGRGIMGYMGNKGSISISMTLHGTSFCFVCTHLASGEKDGDEVRRNSDVMEIMKRTKFLQSHRINAAAAYYAPSPETISKHDKIIWLGDLNYRLACTHSETQELLQKNNWQALLEKDQLRIEQRAGRVFAGWEEGRIWFPPTYKYMANSDTYAVNPAKSREKRRIPSWCDRILWRGKGMKQMWYVRGESRFSDHRPVYSLFSVQLDDDGLVPTEEHRATVNIGSSSSSPSPSSWRKVQAEELFLVARTQSCLEASRFAAYPASIA
ncbi:type I inositol polyphosphate 5-phosphatase 8-like [Canna indica]|uniref:Type I inositol polyphosphate 5-phosphatase 8-like n=1 Tax=Canna indica TaxID=4628 RepID=A0AAQ3K9U0_9LILI|nr:type I inositol polyphosphate 5-phosphatase 8-like [Canna indica]